MKKTLSLITFLLVITLVAGFIDSAQARIRRCVLDDQTSELRDGRGGNRIGLCSETPDNDPSPIPEKELSISSQSDLLPTRVQPGSHSVPVINLLFDATGSDQDILIPSLEFVIDITSYANFESLQNCELYQDGSTLNPSTVSQGIVSTTQDNVTTSQTELIYTLPIGNLTISPHSMSSVELVCDFPSILTEAEVTTQLSTSNFVAVNGNIHPVTYSFITPTTHSIDVYTGDTPPWAPVTPDNDGSDGSDTGDGSDGDDGGDGEDGDDGDDGDSEPDNDDRRGDRDDRTDLLPRR